MFIWKMVNFKGTLLLLFVLCEQLAVFRAATIRNSRAAPQTSNSILSQSMSQFSQQDQNNGYQVQITSSVQGDAKVKAQVINNPSQNYMSSSVIATHYPAQNANVARPVVSSITLNSQNGVYLIACADPENPDKLKQTIEVPKENLDANSIITAQLSCQGAWPNNIQQRTGQVTVNNNGKVSTYQLQP